MVKNILHFLKAKTAISGQSLNRLVLLVLLSLVITVILTATTGKLPGAIKEGDIAAKDIFADQNFKFIDLEATEKLKDEAAEKIFPVYDFEYDAYSMLRSRVEGAFQNARKLSDSFKGKAGDEEALKKKFLEDLDTDLSDDEYAVLRKDGFSEELTQAMTALFEPMLKKFVCTDKASLMGREDMGIMMRVIRTGLSSKAEDDQILNQYPDEESFIDVAAIQGLDEVQTYYSKKTPLEIQDQLSLDFINLDKIRLAVALWPKFVQPNLHLNKIETELRRDKARHNIQNTVYKEIQKGQIIINRGMRYTKNVIDIIAALKDARLNTNLFLRFAGIYIYIASMLALVYIFSYKHLTHFTPTFKDLFFISLSLVAGIMLVRLSSLFGTILKDGINFPIDLKTFYFLMPAALGSLLVGSILNSQSALVHAVVSALITGIYFENEQDLSVYILLTNVFAAHIISGVERRSTVLRYGVFLGLFNALIVFTFNLMTTLSRPESVISGLLATHVIAAFIGGVFSSLAMLAVSPAVETLFNYTTNIKLLELANMNHPLLREMIVRAPGTYHHSQLVGILSEAGARAIDANALLARVASYYHDIGKMKKAQYFIENQKGVNPHDRLPPSMSALIIAAHVRDGLDMAAEYKLPKIISDMIPEHQGTKLIGYFYEKARQYNLENDKGPVDERDFRYPGPKPQSREAGVIMMADAVEAAVRSLSEKSPQKIRNMVEKLINKHFADGQLNECNLTLKDINHVIEAFVKILIGIYHQRVEYPENKAPTLTLATSDAKKDSNLQLPSLH